MDTEQPKPCAGRTFYSAKHHRRVINISTRAPSFTLNGTDRNPSGEDAHISRSARRTAQRSIRRAFPLIAPAATAISKRIQRSRPERRFPRRLPVRSCCSKLPPAFQSALLVTANEEDSVAPAPWQKRRTPLTHQRRQLYQSRGQCRRRNVGQRVCTAGQSDNDQHVTVHQGAIRG